MSDRRIFLAVVIALVIALAYLAVDWVIAHCEPFTINQTQPIVSRVDGKRYRVHANHSVPQAAADTLARLNLRVIDLMRFLRARYMRGAAGVHHPERREAVRRLLARYSPDNLAENSPNDPSKDTAYTLDKGSLVAVCLRQRGSGDGKDPIHDFGTLTFVTLHEMAHIAIDDVGHDPVFWRTFRFLLEEAEDAQIYRSPNFALQPVTYCGVKIDYNPKWDASTTPI